MNINNNIINVRQNLPVGVTLIAVSKTQPIEAIEKPTPAGQRVFGENKVRSSFLSMRPSQKIFNGT